MVSMCETSIVEYLMMDEKKKGNGLQNDWFYGE